MKTQSKSLRRGLLCAAVCVSSSIYAQFPPFGMGGGMSPFGDMPSYPTPEPKEIDVENLASELPLVIIHTDQKINSAKKVEAHMKIVENKKGKLNHVNDTCLNYEGNIGIKWRGNSSLALSQKKYTITTRNADGQSVDVSLLDMPAESDWVMLAPYNDVSLLRDAFAFEMWREMGHWAPRTRMVEMILNGKYVGVYVLCEKIKRGTNRVNINRLKESDIAGRDLTGGYILRIDAVDEEDATFTSKVEGVGGGFMGSHVSWACIYPKKSKLKKEQFDYIHQFIDDMELAIQSDSFTDASNGYAKYIDVESFIDYFLHTEFTLNADGLRRSTYFYKEKQKADGSGGKLHAGPVWDYNLAFGIGGFNGADNIESWVYEGGDTQPISAFWGRLLEDPAYRKAVKKRYEELRKTVLSDKNINAFFDKYARLLKKAQQRHFDTYPELLASEEELIDIAKAKKEGKSNNPFGGMFGGFPHMGDSIDNPFAHMPEGFQFPEGGFPHMGDSIGNPFANMPEGFQFPGGGFPHMGDSIGNPFANMPEGFQFPGGMQMPEGFEMPEGFGNMGGMMLRMFQGYRVGSYEEEIKTIKKWCSDRLKVMDRVISEFDGPFVLKKKERQKMPGFPFGFN